MSCDPDNVRKCAISSYGQSTFNFSTECLGKKEGRKCPVELNRYFTSIAAYKRQSILKCFSSMISDKVKGFTS